MISFYLNNLIDGIKDFMIVVVPFMILSIVVLRLEKKEKDKVKRLHQKKCSQK